MAPRDPRFVARSRRAPLGARGDRRTAGGLALVGVRCRLRRGPRRARAHRRKRAANRGSTGRRSSFDRARHRRERGRPRGGGRHERALHGVARAHPRAPRTRAPRGARRAGGGGRDRAARRWRDGEHACARLRHALRAGTGRAGADRAHRRRCAGRAGSRSRALAAPLGPRHRRRGAIRARASTRREVPGQLAAAAGALAEAVGRSRDDERGAGRRGRRWVRTTARRCASPSRGGQACDEGHRPTRRGADAFAWVPRARDRDRARAAPRRGRRGPHRSRGVRAREPRARADRRRAHGPRAPRAPARGAHAAPRHAARRCARSRGTAGPPRAAHAAPRRRGAGARAREQGAGVRHARRCSRIAGHGFERSTAAWVRAHGPLESIGRSREAGLPRTPWVS